MCRWLLNTGLAILACLLASCGGRGSSLPESPGLLFKLLPAVGGLDSERALSSAQVPIDVTAPLMESGTSPIGSNLALSPAPGGLAWAIYRFVPPVPEILSVAAGGDDGIFLLVADYGSGSWSNASELAAGFAIAPLNTLSNPLSPGGYVYCALVAPSGVQGQISSLALNYDGPANMYFVAPPADGGSDANPGTSADPWATLQHAADSISADSLVTVRPGSYAPFKLPISGTADAPIVFKAQAGAIIDASAGFFGIDLGEGDWITIDGFAIQASNGSGIEGDGVGSKAEHNTLRNNYMSACEGDGIYLNFTDSSLIEGNVCEACGGVGIVLTNDCDDVVIRNNNIFACKNRGIYIGTSSGGVDICSGELITGNTLLGNTTLGVGGGIHLNGVLNSTVSNNLVYSHEIGLCLDSDAALPCTGNSIVNNTVVQFPGEDACLLLRTGSIGNKMYNNIMFHTDPAAFALSFDNGTLEDFLSDNNILNDAIECADSNITFDAWQSIYHYDKNGRLSTPAETFVDPALPDLHLLSTANAVDAALADYAPAVDLDGNVRPQGDKPDCGCFEWQP